MTELDKFQRRLIRSVARLRLREKQTPDKMWATLLKETGRDCKEIWDHMRILTVTKLSRLLAADDYVHKLGKFARMTLTDWLLFDMVLVHEQIDVITVDKSVKTSNLTALEDLFELVQHFKIERLNADPHTRAKAWAALVHKYNATGRECSPMLLQLRWHQLIETSRERLCQFWKVFRGNKRNLPMAKQQFEPTPLQMAISKRFTHLITEPFKSWEERIAEKKVILLEYFIALNRGKKSATKEVFEQGCFLPPENFDAGPSNSVDRGPVLDVVVRDPQIETITLTSDSDEEGSTKNTLKPVTPKQNKTHRNESSEEPINEIESALVDKHTQGDKEIKVQKEPMTRIKIPQNPEIDGLLNVKIIAATHVPTEEIDEPSQDHETDLAAKQLELLNSNHNAVIEAANIKSEIDYFIKNNPIIQEETQDMNKQLEELDGISIVNSILEDTNVTKTEQSVVNDLKNMNDPIIKIVFDSSSDVEIKETEPIDVTNLDNSNPIRELPSNLEFLDDEIDMAKEYEDDVFEVDRKNEKQPDLAEESTSSQVIRTETETSCVNQDSADSDDDKDEAQSPKFDQKLVMLTVVYTTKLDHMTMFQDKDFKAVQTADLINSISAESKPFSTKSVNITPEIEVKPVENQVFLLATKEKTINDDFIMLAPGSDGDIRFIDTGINNKTKMEIQPKTAVTQEKNNDEGIVELAPEDKEEYENSEDKFCEDFKVKPTSFIFQKPRTRNYTPIHLCKNPDFNTRLKKLSEPLTIDLHKPFESELVNNTIYFKSNVLLEIPQTIKEDTSSEEHLAYVTPSARVDIEDLLPANKNQEDEVLIAERNKNKVINLPDIEKVRRLNQHLATAEVSPILVKNTGMLEMSHLVSTQSAQSEICVEGQTDMDITLQQIKNELIAEVRAALQSEAHEPDMEKKTDDNFEVEVVNTDLNESEDECWNGNGDAYDIQKRKREIRVQKFREYTEMHGKPPPPVTCLIPKSVEKTLDPANKTSKSNKKSLCAQNKPQFHRYRASCVPPKLPKQCEESDNKVVRKKMSESMVSLDTLNEMLTLHGPQVEEVYGKSNTKVKKTPPTDKISATEGTDLDPPFPTAPKGTLCCWAREKIMTLEMGPTKEKNTKMHRCIVENRLCVCCCIKDLVKFKFKSTPTSDACCWAREKLTNLKADGNTEEFIKPHRCVIEFRQCDCCCVKDLVLSEVLHPFFPLSAGINIPSHKLGPSKKLSNTINEIESAVNVLSYGSSEAQTVETNVPCVTAILNTNLNFIPKPTTPTGLSSDLEKDAYDSLNDCAEIHHEANIENVNESSANVSTEINKSANSEQFILLSDEDNDSDNNKTIVSDAGCILLSDDDNGSENNKTIVSDAGSNQYKRSVKGPTNYQQTTCLLVTEKINNIIERNQEILQTIEADVSQHIKILPKTPNLSNVYPTELNKSADSEYFVLLSDDDNDNDNNKTIDGQQKDIYKKGAKGQKAVQSTEMPPLLAQLNKEPVITKTKPKVRVRNKPTRNRKIEKDCSSRNLKPPTAIKGTVCCLAREKIITLKMDPRKENDCIMHRCYTENRVCVCCCIKDLVKFALRSRVISNNCCWAREKLINLKVNGNTVEFLKPHRCAIEYSHCDCCCIKDLILFETDRFPLIAGIIRPSPQPSPSKKLSNTNNETESAVNVLSARNSEAQTIETIVPSVPLVLNTKIDFVNETTSPIGLPSDPAKHNNGSLSDDTQIHTEANIEHGNESSANVSTEINKSADSEQFILLPDEDKDSDDNKTIVSDAGSILLSDDDNGSENNKTMVIDAGSNQCKRSVKGPTNYQQTTCLLVTENIDNVIERNQEILQTLEADVSQHIKILPKTPNLSNVYPSDIMSPTQSVGSQKSTLERKNWKTMFVIKCAKSQSTCPINMGKGKLLLTNAKIPMGLLDPEIEDRTPNTDNVNLVPPETLQQLFPMPKGVSLIMAPNGDVSCVTEPGAQLHPSLHLELEHLVKNVQIQLRGSIPRSVPIRQGDVFIISDHQSPVYKVNLGYTKISLNTSVEDIKSAPLVESTGNIDRHEKQTSTNTLQAMIETVAFEGAELCNLLSKRINEKSDESTQNSEGVISETQNDQCDKVSDFVVEQNKLCNDNAVASVSEKRSAGEQESNTSENQVKEERSIRKLDTNELETKNIWIHESTNSKPVENLNNDEARSLMSEKLRDKEEINNEVKESSDQTIEIPNNSVSAKKSILSDLMEMSWISSEDILPAPGPVLKSSFNPMPPGTNIQELTQVTTLAVLKYAHQQNAQFIKYDVANGNMVTIKLSIQKKPAPALIEGVIDLKDGLQPGYGRALVSKSKTPLICQNRAKLNNRKELEALIQQRRKKAKLENKSILAQNVKPTLRKTCNHESTLDFKTLIQTSCIATKNELAARINADDSDGPMEEEYLADSSSDSEMEKDLKTSREKYTNNVSGQKRSLELNELDDEPLTKKVLRESQHVTVISAEVKNPDMDMTNIDDTLVPIGEREPTEIINITAAPVLFGDSTSQEDSE